MSARPETMPEHDVVDLLIAQHEQLRHLFSAVKNAEVRGRKEAFDQLRRYLAVHETAEELVVHPDARRTVPDGDRVVDALLAEEHAAKEKLQELEGMDLHEPGFVSKVTALERAVLDHAEHEEREEFPHLRSAHSSARRKAMGLAVKAAEALAPTHPHAGVESATANMLTGPYVAMLDRARDVIRQGLDRFGGSD